MSGLIVFGSVIFGVLVMFWGIYLYDKAEERKNAERKRQQQRNAEIEQYVARRYRKHNTMRAMRNLARNYRDGRS